MPSLGFPEIIVILLIALIVFGPKKLPEIGRTIGKSVREFRRATSNLTREFEDGLDDDVVQDRRRPPGRVPEAVSPTGPQEEAPAAEPAGAPADAPAPQPEPDAATGERAD